jgi:ankyrin repeat protein
MGRYLGAKSAGATVALLCALAALPACKRYDNSLGKELVASVTSKDVEKFRGLLARRADPNTLDESGAPVLMSVLLNMQISFSPSGQMSGDRQGAATAQIVKLLLDAGADPNAKDKRGNPVLMAAFMRNDPAIVADLIRAGASVKGAESSGSPMIVEAAYSGNLEIVKLMVEAGADVNKSRKDGTTALLVAASKQKWNLSQYLIEKGADVNAHVKAGTALLFAAGFGNLETAKLLVQRGADVNARDDQNRSPLSLSQELKHEQVADFLRSSGAQP